jgi:hypothetical protein
MMLRCNVTAVTDFHFSYKMLIFIYFYGADRPGEAFAGAKYGGRRARHARIATAKGGLPGALRYRSPGSRGSCPRARLRTYRKWELGHPQQSVTSLLKFSKKYRAINLDWLVTGATGAAG